MNYGPRKRVVYIMITEDEEAATAVKRAIDDYRGVWWKFITKYYDGKSEEPYYTTSESGWEGKK